MTRKFLNLVKDINFQIQEAQQILIKIDGKKSMLRYIVNSWKLKREKS